MKMMITFLLVNLMGACSGVQASSQHMDTSLLNGSEQEGAKARPRERISIPGLGVVDYEFLFEVVGQEEQTMDDFASEIGPRLREFSDRTGFEACGVIATDGQRFGAVIGSNRSHVACANFSSKVPAGMRDTGETIHSHGRERGFKANRNDLTLQGHLRWMDWITA